MVASGYWLLAAPTTSAGTIDDLKQEIAAREKEIQVLKEKVQQYNNLLKEEGQKKKTLQNQVYIYNLRIQKLEADLATTKAELAQTELDLERLVQEITAREEELVRQRASLQEVIQTIDEQDKEGMIEFLLKHSDLSDIFNELESLEILQVGLQQKLEGVKIIKAELEQEKTENETKQDELQDLTRQLEDQEAILVGERTQKSELLKKTKEQEQRYQQLLSEVERQQQQIQKEIFELESKLRYTLDPSTIPPFKKGLLSWPSNGTLTQGYGATSETGFKNDAYQFHNGIDIAAGFGSAIRAVLDGKVVGVGDNGKYAYGKWVAVDHGNGLTTLYAHLSLRKVAIGDMVAKRAIIGYEGSTGFSTGSHLHFTVYGTHTFYVATRPYGSLPLGASINPFNYLE